MAVSAWESILPIYVLIDASEGTGPEWAETSRNYVRGVVDCLRADPVMLEWSRISIFTFSLRTERQTGLVAPDAVPDLPSLGQDGRGANNLGQALLDLSTAMAAELRQESVTEPGDCAPLICVLLGSSPTDDIEAGFRELRRHMNYGIWIVAEPSLHGNASLVHATGTAQWVSADYPPADIVQAMIHRLIVTGDCGTEYYRH